MLPWGPASSSSPTAASPRSPSPSSSWSGRHIELKRDIVVRFVGRHSHMASRFFMPPALSPPSSPLPSSRTLGLDPAAARAVWRCWGIPTLFGRLQLRRPAGARPPEICPWAVVSFCEISRCFLQNGRSLVDRGHPDARSDGRELRATWPRSQLAILAANRR